MVGRTNKSLSIAQANSKKYFDQNIKADVQFVAGQSVYLDRASKATKSMAERLEEEPRMKILSQAIGRFKVLSATPDTFTINEDDIRNTVSIDRVSRAPILEAPELQR